MGFHAGADRAGMAWILFESILIPIGLGVAICGIFRSFTDGSDPVLGNAGTVGPAGIVLSSKSAKALGTFPCSGDRCTAWVVA
jgi:predicted Na+-dependent transporter